MASEARLLACDDLNDVEIPVRVVIATTRLLCCTISRPDMASLAMTKAKFILLLCIATMRS